MWLLGMSASAEPWLTLTHAGELEWGTDEQPLDVERRSRSDFLPDAGYIGRSPADKPDDLLLPGPDEERRYVRYVHGALVDAWLVRQGSIDTSAFSQAGEEEWAGVVLGPAEEGWRALGYAQSWVVGDRTVMHWSDRMGGMEILAYRAMSSGAYGVRRAAPVGTGTHTSSRKVQIKGDLKPQLKPHADGLSGCLDSAPKPVMAEVFVRYDGAGRPARLRVETDQPSFNVIDCMAGVVEGTRAEAFAEGSVTVLRMR